MSYFMIRSTYGYLQSGSRVAVAAPAADAVRRESGRAAHLAAVCCGRAVLASRGPWTPWTHVHQPGRVLGRPDQPRDCLYCDRDPRRGHLAQDAQHCQTLL